MRTLITLSLTTLIVLSATLTMSMTFVAMSGLVAILVYASTDSLEAGLALGLLTGLASWVGVSLVPELFAAAQDRPGKRAWWG